MKKFIPLAIFILGSVLLFFNQEFISRVTTNSEFSNENVLADAYKQHLSNKQVKGEGKVQLILSDDNEGSRHQRFLLMMDDGQTVLIAHNIDLAPRIKSLKIGDIVTFSGEYEWNAKGGLVHWTHHDPAGRHQGGWLLHKGKKYQ